MAAELKKHPKFKNLIKRKTVAGSSAGAYVLSKYFHHTSLGDIHKGLKILPIRIICHYESDGFEIKDNPIALISKYPDEFKLIVLKDFEYEVFNQ